MLVLCPAAKVNGFLLRLMIPIVNCSSLAIVERAMPANNSHSPARHRYDNYLST